jgi:hypothetical protein
MRKGKRILQSDYPEKYEINEFTIRDHFYLHFGFPDDARLYHYQGSNLAKYHQPEVDTKLLFRGVQGS